MDRAHQHTSHRVGSALLTAPPYLLALFDLAVLHLLGGGGNLPPTL